MEGNQFDDFDGDALMRRFSEAEMRAFKDGRAEDASDWLIAQHLVCILRGDFRSEDTAKPAETPLRLAG